MFATDVVVRRGAAWGTITTRSVGSRESGVSGRRGLKNGMVYPGLCRMRGRAIPVCLIVDVSIVKV